MIWYGTGTSGLEIAWTFGQRPLWVESGHSLTVNFRVVKNVKSVRVSYAPSPLGRGNKLTTQRAALLAPAYFL